MSGNKSNPPKFAIWLLEYACPGSDNDALAGDLIERFQEGQTSVVSAVIVDNLDVRCGAANIGCGPLSRGRPPEKGAAGTIAHPTSAQSSVNYYAGHDTSGWF